MVKWFIDKNNKMPLYLQVKDLIRYYISTGAIGDNQKLPTVNDLASRLQVNFETVRKAYKELEREGFITTKRGRGSFTVAHANALAGTKVKSASRSTLIEALKDSIGDLVISGMAVDEIKRLAEEALERAGLANEDRVVIFTECNSLQADEISQILRTSLALKVKPVLIEDLREQVSAIYRDGPKLLAVVTTGFHIGEVRNKLADLPVKVDFLVTNMAPETRRELDAIDKKSKFAFICRDEESTLFYREMLKAELGIETEIACCTFDQSPRTLDLLMSSDVVLTSPPVYADVRKLAPADLPVYNVFNRVDPMSLRVVRDSILESS
jgi:DNA-binding transcriptional regulator YhcF (GntR family)